MGAADAMTAYAAFRRQPVQQGYANVLQTVTLPAPTRGLIQNENQAFMAPGGAIVQDNWVSTLRGVKVRGGTRVWCDLHGLDSWDEGEWDISQWDAPVPPMSSPLRYPIVSAFEYVSGDNIHKMFAGQPAILWDVSAQLPTVAKSGQNSGNYAATQLTNMSGSHLIAVNDAGDAPLHYDGSTWTAFTADQITGPAGSNVAHGMNLTYVWKYRNRLFFIEGGTMNAYCLGIDSYQGALGLIPLGGSAPRGGSLLFGATWSGDTGSGTDDKCVFVTTEGDLIIFSGNNPADPSGWQQQGVYSIGRPMGMNAHMPIGGDVLIMTVDGIVPLGTAITKDAGTLDLALITNPIRSMWRQEVALKSNLPWTLKRWDDFGAIFVTWPGGLEGARYCGVMNNATAAWCRFVGYDARCFIKMRDLLFYGTSDGRIAQCEIGGTDNGLPYVATLVGGWETFQAPSAQNVWHQSRAIFTAPAAQPFIPQLNAAIDYVVTVPPPPLAGPDPGVREVWDETLWDAGRWDQPTPAVAPIRNTHWVSIGKSGFAHAPITQITIAQQAPPQVELLAIGATFGRAGINV